MSKQAAVLTLTDLNADTPCCPPIAQHRIPAETAAVLAPAFKALGVRLQLMSMIASAPYGGDVRL
jgi:ArsR family transcriptional regulator, arsenate/arsenite/antimonite-responsive transcriptional repressor